MSTGEKVIGGSVLALQDDPPGEGQEDHKVATNHCPIERCHAAAFPE
jgi:hypothetical protein